MQFGEGAPASPRVHACGRLDLPHPAAILTEQPSDTRRSYLLQSRSSGLPLKSMSSISKPIGRGRRGLTESWRQSAQRNLDYLRRASPARDDSVSGLFHPSTKVRLHYETARSGGDHQPERNWQRRTFEVVEAPCGGRQAKGSYFKRASIQPHLHRDPDQVRMVLRAKLLLEQ